MPDTHVAPTPGVANTRTDPSAWWRRMAAEPLVHFLAIGAVLFGIAAAVAPASDETRVIAVTRAVRQTISDQYAGVHLRPPTEAELAPLLENWVRTQILYREAMALGLDKGDDMIRERITHKMNLLVFSNIRLPEPTDAQLAAFLEANRGRYDQPARYDFLGLLPGAGLSREQAEAIAQQLSDEEAEPPADLVARVRPYANRTRDGAAALFGAVFADTLTSMAQDTWRAVPIAVEGSGETWLVTRLARVRAGRAAVLDEIRGDLIDGWQVESARLAAQKAVAEMGRKYRVTDVGAP